MVKALTENVNVRLSLVITAVTGIVVFTIWAATLHAKVESHERKLDTVDRIEKRLIRLEAKAGTLPPDESP